MESPSNDTRLAIVAGAIVLVAIAAYWAFAGLAAIPAMPSVVAIIVPAAVSGVLFVLVIARVRALRLARATVSAERRRRAIRLLLLVDGVQLLAIVIAANLLQRYAPDLMLPAIAAIVGLHFLPLARAFRVRRYVWTGLALIAIALVSLLLPANTGTGEETIDLRAVVVGLCGAAVLWVTVLASWRATAPV